MKKANYDFRGKKYSKIKNEEYQKPPDIIKDENEFLSRLTPEMRNNYQEYITEIENRKKRFQAEFNTTKKDDSYGFVVVIFFVLLV